MKTIGLIGGMSWESTATYYKGLNIGVRDRLGGLHSARILMSSVDFASIAELQAAGRWDDAGNRLADEALKLQHAGADLIVLATNTMHKVADRISGAITIPFLNIGDATARSIVSGGIRRVGLLATLYTMEENFYIERLEKQGLTVFVPEREERRDIHRVIYDELCRGVIRDSSRRLFIEVASRLFERGAKGLIFGCTEIGLLTGQRDFAVPVFDTTKIHIDAALDFALGGEAQRAEIVRGVV